MPDITTRRVPSSVRKSRLEEDQMTAESSGRIPKRGDRVGIGQQEGVYEIAEINSLMQTANVKTTDGQGHITRNVSWDSLKFLDKK